MKKNVIWQTIVVLILASMLLLHVAAPHRHQCLLPTSKPAEPASC